MLPSSSGVCSLWNRSRSMASWSRTAAAWAAAASRLLSAATALRRYGRPRLRYGRPPRVTDKRASLRRPPLGTNAWTSVRGAAAGVFRRGGAKGHDKIGDRLDDDASLVAAADDQEGERTALEPFWRLKSGN